MSLYKTNNFLFKKLESIKGVGKKLSSYLKQNRMEKVKDLLFNFPYSSVDRSNQLKINKLLIGSICTIVVRVRKYNFPRVKNLPNKVICEDETGKIEIIFFNSREGYIKNILPLNKEVVISSKVGFYKGKYQMTNPEYISKPEKLESIKQIMPKYTLSKDLNEKIYKKVLKKILDNLEESEDWHQEDILKKFKFESWKKSIQKIHKIEKNIDTSSPYFRRIAFDEIISNLIILSNNRLKLKKTKKEPKKIKSILSSKLIKELDFILTGSQKRVIDEINNDLKSNKKMFRILQGDVGSGKTIVSLITAANVIENKKQCALMAPTEILANQHFQLAKKFFLNTNFKIELLTGKIKSFERKRILENLEKGKIDFLIGTHSLFQEKIFFKNLEYLIIDEQHKFGVSQRMKMSEKGGTNCDVLLMSATPIPRTMMLTNYGDMDLSRLNEKPMNRKKIITLSKPIIKINEIYSFIEKNIKDGGQVFWVCPLIEDSTKLDYMSVKKRFLKIKKDLNFRTAIIHGSTDQDEKNLILKKFLNKKIDILVSTTVIEVGIDFPNANVIIIENSEKFGLAQLHQLRGRVGRGEKQSYCVLMYKNTLSKNAYNRLKILKKSDDGFYIADEDLKLRGFGDIIGYQQSGEKYFKIANPIIHEDLFYEAEKYMRDIEKKNIPLSKYNFLLKLFDKTEIIN